jgi:hypothetical protein
MYSKLLRQAADRWNAYRQDNPDDKPDISGFSYAGMDMSGVNFADCICRGTNFCDCKLDLATFVRADLTGAQLKFASLAGANFTGAVLVNTAFSGAIFSETEAGEFEPLRYKLPSARETKLQAIADGATAEGAEIYVTATALQRHTTRTLHATHAAQHWVSWLAVYTASDWPMGHRDAYTGMVLRAEAQGLYGGGYQCPGASTTRHPAFWACGTGRRLAYDGAAWTAAIGAAAAKYSEIDVTVNETGLTLTLAGHKILEKQASLLLTHEGIETMLRRVIMGSDRSAAIAACNLLAVLPDYCQAMEGGKNG